MSLNSFKVELCFETHVIVHVGKTISKTILSYLDGSRWLEVDSGGSSTTSEGLNFYTIISFLSIFFLVHSIFFFPSAMAKNHRTG